MSDIAPDAKAQTDQQNDKVNKSPYRLYLGLPDWIRLAVKVCLGLWVLNFILGVLPLEERGTFGDTFGAANSLFSALALLGVAWSVSMQREELKVTHEDRKDTQKNLNQTQELLRIQEANINKQNSATTKQMFEATFFQMFSAFSDVTREIEIRYIPNRTPDIAQERAMRMNLTPEQMEDFERSRYKTASGREAFEVLVSIFEKKFEIQLRNRRREDPKGHEDATGDEQGFPVDMHERYDLVYKRAYNSLFREYGDDIGRYFRTLYTIMSFVQNAEIPEPERKTYIKFVRAQLSMHEATMLMLNYLSPYTTEKFNTLCVQYGMGKNAYWKNSILQRMSYRLPHGLRGRRAEELNSQIGSFRR